MHLSSVHLAVLVCRKGERQRSNVPHVARKLSADATTVGNFLFSMFALNVDLGGHKVGQGGRIIQSNAIR